MAFDFDKLMERADGYGLDASIRAIAAAAYQQGYDDGVDQGGEIEGAIGALSRAIAALKMSVHSTGAVASSAALENAARGLGVGSDLRYQHTGVFGVGSQEILDVTKYHEISALAYSMPSSIAFPKGFRAPTSPVGLAVNSATSGHSVSSPEIRSVRVARGLVRDTVAKALEREPGKSIKEYEHIVLELEPEISVKSVGNELRRGEADGRYKRDRPGGYRWYLASSEIEAADNDPTEAAASYSNNGGDDEPDNMT